MTTLPEAVSDLATASPLSYEQIRELNARRELAPALAAMTSRERIGAAAVLAKATGRALSKVLDLFARLVEGAPVPPPAAPALPRTLVPSESEPGLFYIVTRESCTCPGFRFQKACKHTRRTPEEWTRRVRAVLARPAALVAA